MNTREKDIDTLNTFLLQRIDKVTAAMQTAAYNAYARIINEMNIMNMSSCTTAYFDQIVTTSERYKLWKRFCDDYHDMHQNNPSVNLYEAFVRDMNNAIDNVINRASPLNITMNSAENIRRTAEFDAQRQFVGLCKNIFDAVNNDTECYNALMRLNGMQDYEPKDKGVPCRKVF